MLKVVECVSALVGTRWIMICHRRLLP